MNGFVLKTSPVAAQPALTLIPAWMHRSPALLHHLVVIAISVEVSGCDGLHRHAPVETGSLRLAAYRTTLARTLSGISPSRLRRIQQFKKAHEPAISDLEQYAGDNTDPCE